MGLFSSIGGIIGGIKGKKYSKKAAKAQIAGMEKGIGEQRAGMQAVQGYFNPYQTTGNWALGAYGNLLGQGGAEAQQAAINQLQQSPFYQSLYNRGEEAVLQNAAATGGLRGGNTQRSLADFGADTLATTIDRQLGYLGGLSQMGYGAAGQLSQAQLGTSGNITDLYVGQGQAKADDYMRRAALSSQIWQNAGGMADQAASFAMGGFGAPGGGFNLSGAMASPGGQAMFGGSPYGGGYGGYGGYAPQPPMNFNLPTSLPAGWGL